MKTVLKLTIGTSLLAGALLLVAVPSQAQTVRKTTDQILRQAQQIQQRQQAIETIVRDGSQAVLDIVNAYQQRKEDAAIQQPPPDADAEAPEQSDYTPPPSPNQ